ncbi:uncharacterized protein BJX67DRAFT_363566 [Aspergillus lucknowensis]|uniref:Alpha/Beta hydrolase protein n=1 Tax=Aspergillus lucknowensis TaxID=176173 RepID=A0ABR4LJ92_9EURO
MEEPLHVAPYQTRPLVFRLIAVHAPNTEFMAEIHYNVAPGGTQRAQYFRMNFVEKSLSQPQRLTYLHPAGIVSYAILRPPPLKAHCVLNQSHNGLPVIIGLHGAGLDADSVQVREMLDAASGICAWTLFPSGVTSWSGDDWHTWALADIKAAIDAVSRWVGAIGWSGPGILTSSWIATGHSNGGQGVWFLVTHQPDSIVAASPVSGYSSIENYVPFNMWHDPEPLISSILHQSRASFKHELLLGNAAGIPILQQHGSDDTNVPAYHSRLMHELLERTGWTSDYVELRGKGHWFNGVMTTAPLLKFYEDSLRSIPAQIPSTYTMTVPSSGDMSSKGGLYVDQLESPDLVGRLRVKRDVRHGIWYLQTQNIHRFHLSDRICELEESITLAIDDANTRFKVDLSRCESTWYIRDTHGGWLSSSRTDWQSLYQRYGRQVGAMDAILRTSGIFTIRICSIGIDGIALQTSRNLLQYFAADSRITHNCSTSDTQDARGSRPIRGNIITLSLGNNIPNSTAPNYPVRVTSTQIILSRTCSLTNPGENAFLDSNEGCHQYAFNHEPGMGALFLRPLEDESLELVVWGADIDGLEQAARLVPTLTGAGQPELIIISDSCRWNGHAGLYAAGHFDKFWQISSGSYISSGI